MTQEGSPKAVSKALAKIEQLIYNPLEIGSDAAIKQFAPAEELDTGGIDPDAYTAELFADYEEAIGTMGFRRIMQPIYAINSIVIGDSSKSEGTTSKSS
jgi:hypothetical protein